MTAQGLALPRRSREAELMDSEDADYGTFRACLVDLERVNRASLGYRPTLRWLEGIADGHRALRVLDVGSGHGDMLRRIWRWAQARGVAVELTGVDLNPWAAKAAAEATRPGMAIRYETSDVFALAPERPFDIIISALFAHHLSDPDLVRFVAWMQASARIGWFVNDLHRHWLPEAGLGVLFRLLPVHRFVRHDGPVSVRRAFTRAELQDVLAAAGVPAASAAISWHFPFRWGMGTVAR